MWSGVNRITNDGNVRGPEQRVSRLGALKAVTLDAAYSLQMEKDVGSIEPGKLANLTILYDNPVTSEALKIKDIQVWGTVQEGRVLPVTVSAPMKRGDAGEAAIKFASASGYSKIANAAIHHLIGLLSHTHSDGH